MTKKIIFLVMLIPILATAQIEIKGTVLEGGTPVIFASVELKNSENKTINGGVTDDNGNFIISYTKEGKAIVINFIGLKEKVIDLTTQQLEKDIDFGTILLEEDAQYLDEVVVNVEKKLIEYKVDRIVLNIENNVIASSGDAIDAINTAPGVLIQDNAINLLGRGASRVMVNDRVINLSGEDLITYLNSIPGSSIKSIEVIKTPPAKYEAQGNGGLINIILKKAKNNSWNNSTSFSFDQNRHSFGNLSNNFAYNKDKLSFTINLNGRKGAVKALENSEVIYPDSRIVKDLTSKNRNDDFSGRIIMDYDINDKLKVGLQYSGRYNNPDVVDYEANITEYDVDDVINSIVINNIDKDNDNKNHSFNTHLVYKLDTLGRKVSFDYDYFDFNSKKNYITISNVFDRNMNLISEEDIYRRDFSNLNIENNSFTIDIDHPTDFLNLSYGGKYSLIQSLSDYSSFELIEGNETEIADLTDKFSFEEETFSIYLNANKNIGEKLSLQLGLRMENTNNEGVSINNQINKFDYLKLFPSFYASYKIDEKQSVNFNYGKRIDRPGFNKLNPYRFQNANFIFQGNPFLRPSFTDSFDLTYSHNKRFSTNIFLSIYKDGSEFISIPNESDNTILREPLNYFNFYNYGIGEVFNSKINSWWKTNSQIYLLHSNGEVIRDIDTEILNGFRLYFSSNNSFSVSKNTRLQLNYYYDSAHKFLISEKDATSRLDIGMNQSFLENKLKLGIVLNDIFNDSKKQNEASIVNDVKNTVNTDFSRRSIRFSLSYSFGNNKIRGSKQRSGNKEERGRSGN